MHTAPQFVTTHNQQFTSLFTIHCTQLVTIHNQQFTSLFTIYFTQYYSLSRLTISSSHHSLLSISHSTTVCHDSQSAVHITLYYPFQTVPQFVTTHNQQFTSLFTIHCTQYHSLSRLTINSSHHSLLSIAHSTTICHDSQSTLAERHADSVGTSRVHNTCLEKTTTKSIAQLAHTKFVSTLPALSGPSCKRPQKTVQDFQEIVRFYSERGGGEGEKRWEASKCRVNGLH